MNKSACKVNIGSSFDSGKTTSATVKGTSGNSFEILSEMPPDEQETIDDSLTEVLNVSPRLLTKMKNKVDGQVKKMVTRKGVEQNLKTDEVPCMECQRY